MLKKEKVATKAKFVILNITFLLEKFSIWIGSLVIKNWIEKIKSKLTRSTPIENTIGVSEAFNSAPSVVESIPQARKLITSVPYEKYYPLVLILFTSYLAADLTILMIRDQFIPNSAPPSMPQKQENIKSRMRSEYNLITDRNIFNADGVIPNPITTGEDGLPSEDGPAVKSSLPLTLIGTIVHVNPGKSVATIQSKGNQDVIPYIPNDEIDTLAVLVRVERRKAIIRNSNNNRLEYIEIPEDAKLSFKTTAAPTPSGLRGDGTNFSMKRTDLNNYLKDLPSLLQQATAVPNIGAGGEVDGFKMLQMEPNSIFSQIGLKVGDVIKGVNGENVSSPAKAMELYNSLRNEGKIELEIERDGRPVTLNFNID